MKTLILLILSLLILPLKSFSQVDVTATSGTSSASYTSLSNAFNFINNGTHQGDIVITINANTSNFFIQLNYSGSGSANYNSIRIKPGAVGQINIDNSGGGPMFYLNGVDNLTIDGTMPGGLGPLAFRSPNYVFTYANLHFFNDAQNDTVRNCYIQSNSGMGIAITNSATTNGNKNIVLCGNNIGNISASAFPQYGIYAAGSSDNVTISGNYIHDVILSGSTSGSIYSSGASNWKIKNNHIYYSSAFAPTATTSIYGIYSIGNTTSCEITNNVIGYADTAGTAPAIISSSNNTTFVGISAASTQNGTYIKNNIIDGFDFTTGNFSNPTVGSWCGILYTNLYDSYIDSNRIGKTSGASSIKVTHTGGIAVATGISFTNGGGTQYVRNNTIGSIEVAGSVNTLASKFYAFNINAQSTYNFENNIIGDSSTTATPNSISVGSLTATASSQFVGYNVEQSIYPTVNILNCTIRNCRTRTNSDTTLCAGIRTNGMAGYLTITNNSIKNLEALSSSTGSSKVFGIYHVNNQSYPNTFKGNQINNLNSICGTGIKSCAIGIYATSNTTNFDSNFVHDISTNSSTTGILGGAVGIYGFGNVLNNRVYNIINTNTTVNYIYAVGIFEVSGETKRNMVYDVKTQTANKSTVEGIRFGGQYIHSNVISLGNGITTDATIKAINDTSFFSSKIIAFNSIYIGGTQSSNISNTMCYYLTNNTQNQFYNNIFYNTRGSTGSPGIGTGRHYVLKINFPVYSNLIISYNNLTADGNGGTFSGNATTDLNTLADFKTANNANATFCFSSDPQYNSPTNSPADLTLPLNNKQSNGGARLNAFFNTDFNGNTRSIPSANRPDMGAYEADYGDPTIDLQEPYIYYSNLTQDLAVHTTRTLTNFVFVSDNKSISNTNPPRVYYKRVADPNTNLPVATNTPSDPMGWRYCTGTTSDVGGERGYSFVIDYALMNPGSTITGDATSIQYFVAIEDNSGNFNSNAFGASPGSPLVSVISQPTATISSYALRVGIQGTYYIKAGGAPLYNSFGLFTYYYNTGIVTGDVTIVLGGDIIGDDQIGLSNTNSNPNNYKVTIRPDGNTVRTFENINSFSNNVYLNSMSNLTIDGRNPNTGTGKYLRFVSDGNNNQTKAIVNFYDNSHKNTIRNCILESNTATDPIFYFYNYPGANGCDSNTISNCDFRPSAGTYTGRYKTAIYFENISGHDSACTGTKIDSCDFLDFSGFCISMDKASSNENVTISHNKFHQSQDYGAILFPLRFQAYGTNLIADNEIYNMYTSQSVYGMYILEAQNTTITRNKINISPFGSTNPLYGIYLLSAGTFNTTNIINNQIRIEPTSIGNQSIIGIEDFSSTTTVNILYNSVYIGGQSTGTAKTYCAMRENSFSNASTWNTKNNIFYNNRTIFSGTAQHLCIGNKNVDYGMFMNYNFFVGRNTGFLEDYLYEDLGTPVSLYNWKLASAGRDANSSMRIANTINVSNFFQSVSTCDLRINPNQTEGFYVKGMGYPETTPVVSTDFNGAPRSTLLTTGSTTIGASEVTPNVETAPIVITGPFDIGYEYPIYQNERFYGSIKFNTAVQPTSLSLYYYGGSNPPNAVNSFGNSFFKILVTGNSTGLDYDLKLAFDDRELNNITAPASSNLAMAKSNDYGVTWGYVPGSTYDNSGFFQGAIAYHLTSFSLFSFTGLDSPLPVELSEFSSTTNRNDVTLKWITVSEHNSSKFEIERKISSTDSWSKIGSVNAAGNSNQPKNYIFDDRRLQTGKYKYRLKQIDFNGTFKYYDLHNEVEVGLPKDYKLSQNYPNPFNPTSKIDYELPFDSKVEIRIYDMTGREMNVLVNQQQTAGFYTVQFNGNGFSSGTYFYRIAAKSTTGKDFSKTLKMVLVK